MQWEICESLFEGVEKNFRSLAMEDRKFWALNKEVGKYEHLLASVKKGQIIVLEVWNIQGGHIVCIYMAIISMSNQRVFKH